MTRVLVWVALTTAVWAQTGMVDRIAKAPLPAEERSAISEAFSRKDYPRLETLLASGASRHALLGALEFLGGRMSQAVAAFRQGEPLDDQDRFTLAMALVDLGDAKGSRVELTRLSEAHPDQPLYLYWLARLDYGERLYDEAVAKFKTVTKMEPGSVRGYDNLGLSYDMAGLTEDAKEAFAKAVELNRKAPKPSPWPPHNLGYLQLRLRQFDKAEQNLREALQYDAKFAMAHYHLGRVLEGTNKAEAAIEQYKTAAALDPSLAVPLYNLGLLLRRTGRESEAAAALAEYQRRKALAP